NDEGLKRCKVMGKTREAGRKQAGMLQFGGEELNRERQASDGEDFLMNRFQNGLRGDFLLHHALAQGAEEVRLFNVFFALQNRGHIASVPRKTHARPDATTCLLK